MQQLTSRKIEPSIFKAYDIRGLVPQELDEDIAYRIARALASVLKCRRVVVGHDMRESAKEIVAATIRGLLDQGADVVPIGLTSTPMYYYAVNVLKGDAGMMITASHNPAEYNGYKNTGPEAIPSIAFVSNERLHDIAEAGDFPTPERKGELLEQVDILDDYVEAVLENARIRSFGDLKIVVDAGNGMAGLTLPALFEKVGSRPVPLFWELDGRFPNHEANPLKMETLKTLQQTVVAEKADLGVAFDGDADRVAFVTEKGDPISGDLITALIAREMLQRQPGAKIMYDLRSSRVVKEEIEKAGGLPVKCRVGHGLIKKQMREEKGYFAGELSSHYYFSDFFYTDNGDLAMLNLIKLICREGKPVSEMVAPLRRYYHSGEINSEVHDIQAKLAELESLYRGGEISHLDGLTVEFDDWWFNVRPSNTEPLLRLNLEAKTPQMLEEKKEELLGIIRSENA